MKKRCNFLPSAAAGMLCLGLGFVPASAQAQTKPPESTSKVKKVLLYNKIGGFVHTFGIADVKSVMTKLAAAKGFQLTQLETEANITLNYLKQFNVIVWNNNTNGASSVSSTTARTAIIDYVNQGGGWLLIHGAGDHKNTWTELQNTMGTQFTVHGDQGPAEAVIDAAAKAHRELKWMVEGQPASFQLTDEWYAFQTTVRPLAGVTVVATARSTGTGGVVVDYGDKTTDRTYIWAREVQQGRMLYNAIGHGENSLMAQRDSVVPKFYWQNLRYLAGDFKNGCTNRNAGNFDSTARVDNGTCSGGISGIADMPGITQPAITVVGKGYQTRLNFPHESRFSVELRDTRGALVWSRVLENTSEVRLDGSIRPGMYHMVAKAGKNVLTHRLTLL